MGSSDELKKGEGLVDLIFSWSLADVLNKDLYKTQVKPIPETFSSTKEYMDSFIYPLIQDTHSILSEIIRAVHLAPTQEIWTVNKSKDFKPPRDLYYHISMNRKRDTANGKVMHEPKFGDLIALTEVRPKTIADLDRPKSPYVIAVVQRIEEYGSGKFEIRASKPIVLGEYGDRREDKNKRSLFVVYLGNFITEIRIWTALKSELEGGNMNIIKRVLQPDSTDDVVTKILYVKLIWGPPGTGKTKTVASLLFVLLRIKCRTLTCAPTNIAVFEVASRLMSLVSRALEYDTYGLGDIVLFGIGERMKIDDHEDTLGIFLDFRMNTDDDHEDIWDVLLDCRVCIDDTFWKSMEKVKDIEIRKEALSLLIKISCGWRRPHKEANLISLSGISTRFLEYYKVNERLNLVWTVVIHEEKYDYKQVLVVWDISALSDIAEVAKKLDNFFRSYPLDVMSLC
ncbi:hypothetical protein RHGRI_022515 [Rhododendron griersonianum]|uniref:DNA2/NAM7 helicase helicase domain-containing protein n=1 Tax=Rhododendron griersonianum TaxID=479676 RepID=A0AAV6J2B5_9ERIC|nr:hypothetical protein RHGRI_022515 [Rhododendron griersonianum]